MPAVLQPRVVLSSIVHGAVANEAAALTRIRSLQDWMPLQPISVVDGIANRPHHKGRYLVPKGAAVAGLSHRQTEILNIARASGRVIVEDLARRFEVSAQTIRKDLNDLCDQRSLTRIHGGAIIASGVENLAYEARRFVAAEEKRAIGIAAASRIPNGCSLFINIGTTTEEVASALTSHEDLLVITNNLNVAMLLYRHPRIEVIVAGGAVRRADGAVIGSTAISLIGQFKVDYAIIGASAIDEEGALLDFDYREVQAAQAIIANARSVMLVADSTKLRRSAPVRIAHLSQIQTFVTEAPLPAGLANICHSRGIDVVEAMDKPAADIDEPVTEPSTVVRLK
jgi:DeoR family transcriptional regulator, glycerol-3-phosphate regulon repressor